MKTPGQLSAQINTEADPLLCSIEIPFGVSAHWNAAEIISLTPRVRARARKGPSRRGAYDDVA
jgi:hypothetical protein